MWNHELVRKKMEEEGRTTKWLAEKAGIEVGSLGNCLRGQKPSSPVIKLIAIHLNLSEEDLLRTPSKKATKKAI